MSGNVGQFHAESLKFDKRLVQMNQKSGVLQPGEYEKSKEALPDLQHNAVPLNIKGDSAAASPVAEDVPAAQMQEAQPMQNSQPMQQAQPMENTQQPQQNNQPDNTDSAFTSPADEDDKPSTSGGGGFFGM